MGLERESGGNSDECRLSEDDNGKATIHPSVCPVAAQTQTIELARVKIGMAQKKASTEKEEVVQCVCVHW